MRTGRERSNGETKCDPCHLIDFQQVCFLAVFATVLRRAPHSLKKPLFLHQSDYFRCMFFLDAFRNWFDCCHMFLPYNLGVGVASDPVC